MRGIEARRNIVSGSPRGTLPVPATLRGLAAPSPLSNMLRPYALRHVPQAAMACVQPLDVDPKPGDLVLVRVETIGKNTKLEIANGRNVALHEGDLIGAVFGARYATHQFEGYAKRNGDECHLLSMGGLCGLVTSKHDKMPEPTRLRILGALTDGDGRALSLRDYSLPPLPPLKVPPRVIVVCGSSMDSGKTHTAMSTIVGFHRSGYRVAGIKLTGTGSGRDTWSMADAGAVPALDFTDGGHGSTFQCPVNEIIELYDLLLAHAAAQADHVVVEIADGLLQAEISALLTNADFVSGVAAFVFTTGDPLAAVAGIRLLADWGIRPVAISGLISMSPLAMREATAHTGVDCVTSQQLQAGEFLQRLPTMPTARPRDSKKTAAVRRAVI